MTKPTVSQQTHALAVPDWEPPEGLSPEEVQAVIAAAASERDRLLVCVL